MAPRANVQRLQRDEGRFDGLALGALYVLGSSVYPLVEAVAALVGTHSPLALASGVGRAVIAPLVVRVVAETVLGASRAYRAGLCLVPLVVLGTVRHAGVQLGFSFEGPPLWPEVGGGLLAGAWAWWLRPAVRPEPRPERGSGAPQPLAAERPAFRGLAAACGALLVCGVIAVAAVDTRFARVNWSTMGPVPPGVALTSFSVRRLEGDAVGPDDLKGKVSVVTFWATWCRACRAELQELDELHREYRDDRRVQFLAVNAEGSGYSLHQRQRLARQHAAATGLGLPIAIDEGAMARALRVRAIPHTLIVDAAAVVRRVHVGRVTAATVASEVADLLRED